MKHYILIKYHPSVQETRKSQELYAQISALFQEAAAVLPGIRAVSLHPACLASDIRYDLMICMEMEKEALAVFDASEYHRQWKERFSPYIAQKGIFDCEERAE